MSADLPATADPFGMAVVGPPAASPALGLVRSSFVPKPGLYRMTAEEYFADPCPAPSLTQSVAKILLERSPLHAWAAHPRLGKPADGEDEREAYSAAKAIGNAAHRLLLGEGKVIAEGEFNNWQSKAAKDFREEHEAAGCVVILSKHLARAHDLVAALRTQLAEAGLGGAFDGGAGEVVVAWEERGVWLRSMIDYMTTPAMIYDLKTTGASFTPAGIGVKAAEDGWDIQAAIQERGLDVLDPGGAGRRRHRFVVVEQDEPFAALTVEMPESWMMMGRKKLAVAIDLWRECLARDRWPGFPAEIVHPDYPGYLETRWLERETGEFADRLRRAQKEAA